MDKTIRFIDSGYKTLFSVPDGGKIKITVPNGRALEHTCKYIDEYHFYLDNSCLHICQFAEMMERNGNTYEPIIEHNNDLQYARQHCDCFNADKFIKTENGFSEIYYNPDATAGIKIPNKDMER